jgi:hypothetical protein
MAVLLVLGWFRSGIIRDRIAFHAFDAHHIVCSSEGMVTWFRYVDSRDGHTQFQWSSSSLSPEDHQKFFLLDGDVIRFTNEKSWRTLGIGYREGGEFHGGPHFCQWGLQYWVVVFPLTGFSVILFFSKPRSMSEVIPIAHIEKLR